MSFNRATYSITVGVISALIYLSVLIFLMDILVRISIEHEDKIEVVSTRILISLILSCCLMIAFSVLLIVGVVKRRHRFISPLLDIYSIVCFFTVAYVVVHFFDETFSGFPMSSVFLHLFLGLLVFGVELSILFPILTLHRDIRASVLVNV